MKYLLWIGILILFSFTSFSQNTSIDNIVKAGAVAGPRAAGMLAKELKALGFHVKEDVSTTGITGILKNGDGPLVIYKADMDCNVIAVNRACDHAAHVAMLIKVAKAMTQVKDKWRGTLVVVAEPAEEAVPDVGYMVNDGHYAKHSIPQPYVMQENAGLAIKMKGIEDRMGEMDSEDQHLAIHNARNDYCYIIVGLADLTAIPFGVGIGVASLLEIFTWATASR